MVELRCCAVERWYLNSDSTLLLYQKVEKFLCRYQQIFYHFIAITEGKEILRNFRLMITKCLLLKYVSASKIDDYRQIWIKILMLVKLSRWVTWFAHVFKHCKLTYVSSKFIGQAHFKNIK